MNTVRKFFLLVALMLLFGEPILSQTRSFISFTPQRNQIIRHYDTLRMGPCYNLDPSTIIGVVWRTWQVDMWVAVFKNNRKDQPVNEFDTVNFSEDTRFYFYRTSNSADGTVIIWESKYDFDSELRAYLFKNGTVRKLGKIDVDLDDISTDKISYPVSAIRIKMEQGDIMFTFDRHLIFRLSERYAPDEFYYVWDGISQLIPVKKGIPGNPLW